MEGVDVQYLTPRRPPFAAAGVTFSVSALPTCFPRNALVRLGLALHSKVV